MAQTNSPKLPKAYQLTRVHLNQTHFALPRDYESKLGKTDIGSLIQIFLSPPVVSFPDQVGRIIYDLYPLWQMVQNLPSEYISVLCFEKPNTFLGETRTITITTAKDIHVIDVPPLFDSVKQTIRNILEDPRLAKVSFNTRRLFQWLSRDFNIHPLSLIDFQFLHKTVLFDMAGTRFSHLFEVFLKECHHEPEGVFDPYIKEHLEMMRKHSRNVYMLWNRIADHIRVHRMHSVPTILETLHKKTSTFALIPFQSPKVSQPMSTAELPLTPLIKTRYTRVSLILKYFAQLTDSPLKLITERYLTLWLKRTENEVLVSLRLALEQITIPDNYPFDKSEIFNLILLKLKTTFTKYGDKEQREATAYNPLPEDPERIPTQREEQRKASRKRKRRKQEAESRQYRELMQ